MLATFLSRALAERPERAAVAYGETAMSFRELGAAADRLAGALALAPGDRVALVAPNVPALVVGLCACWKVGAVAVPLSARLRHFELARAFADAEPTAAVSVRAHAGFELAEEIEELERATPGLRARVVVDELGEILKVTHSAAPQPAGASADDPAAILYTSGTTGEPKGALVPHRLADAMAHNLRGLLDGDADSPYALSVPASHAFGLGCLLAGISGGATAVLAEVTTSIEPLVEALRRHAATVAHGTPALFRRLLRADSELRIRRGFVAGALCPPELLEALDGRGARILNLYGMTEIGAAASCRFDDPPSVRYTSVGRALPGYELRIAAGGDDDAPGEIQVRSDYLPQGYHGRPWGQEELTEDGWFRTGDLGALDGARNLTLAGRAKEVVHVGGFNVFPAEVETFLLTHPSVAFAAVIGVPHPALGEALQAFVVPVAGANIEPRELIAFARSGIAGYKVPYTVHLIDELPLLPSGKPDRRALADRREIQEVGR
jgi:acyl-CoA synthetase (AMP-forming)/AMP-acid ligase II